MDHITLIPLADLHESPFNPRKHFSDAALAELAEDIKAQGILSPLLVRPRVPPLSAGDEAAGVGYELAYGHRRLRAAELAGLDAAPCIVRSMSDVEVKRAQISENLQREDVHPIEEAEGYQALIDEHGETADTIAAQTGKSRSYIYGRLKLLQACPRVRSACLDGSISTEVALLIARLHRDKLQEKALARIEAQHLDLEDGGAKSYRQIRELLREHFTLGINRAMFDPADATLLPGAGACTACPKLSGNAPEYADLTQPGKNMDGGNRPGDPALCTDPDCFDLKKKTHLRAQADALQAKGIAVIDGNKARAAIDARGNIKGGYVALKDVKAAIKKTGAKIDTVLIQDPRTGKTHEAVKTEQAKQAGLQLAEPKPQNNKWSNHEEQRRLDADLATAESAARRRLLHQVRQTMLAKERTDLDLRLLAKHILDVSVDHEEGRILAELWGCKDFNELEATRTDTMTTAELAQLMMDCALVVDVEINRWQVSRERGAKGSPNLLAAAAYYGIDIDAARAEVQTPAPAAQAAPAPLPQQTAAQAPKGARPAAYRNAKLTGA